MVKPTPESTEKMNREADRQILVREARHLAAEIERDRRVTALSQQSREKSNFYWQVYKDKLEDRRCMLRSKTRELEDFEEHHIVQVLEIKQRLKNLCYDLTQASGAIKMTSEKDHTRNKEDHKSRELELRRDLHALERVRKEEETEHAVFLVDLQRGHVEDVRQLKSEYEKRAQEIRGVFEHRVEDMRASLEAAQEERRKFTDARNKHRVESVLVKQSAGIMSMKQYFGDILANAAETIQNLKRSVGELRSQEDLVQAQIDLLVRKNRIVIGPLQGARAMQLKLESCAAELEKGKRELNTARDALKAIDHELMQVGFANEVLSQKLEELKKRQIQARNAARVTEFNKRQTKSLRTMALTKGIDHLEASTEATETAHSEIMAITATDQGSEAAPHHRYKVSKVAGTKDAHILSLVSQIDLIQGRTLALKSWATGQIETRGLLLEVD